MFAKLPNFRGSIRKTWQFKTLPSIHLFALHSSKNQKVRCLFTVVAFEADTGLFKTGLTHSNGEIV